MRSEICNGYFCPPLKSYQSQVVEHNEVVRVLAVQRNNSHWQAGDPDVDNSVVQLVLVSSGDSATEVVDVQTTP